VVLEDVSAGLCAVSHAMGLLLFVENPFVVPKNNFSLAGFRLASKAGWRSTVADDLCQITFPGCKEVSDRF
jgi:hypothetical protein